MALKSFVQVAPESHFPLENLPYGVFKLQSGSEARPAVAIGDYILDLSVIASAGLFDGPLLSNSDSFNQVKLILNLFLAIVLLLGVQFYSVINRLAFIIIINLGF